jgi:hypothetical protein
MCGEPINTRIIQTYVTHKGKEYFISTINRESSSMYGGIYAETLVWEWDRETRERGDLVGQDEGSRDSIRAHLQMVERIFKTGKCVENED